MHFEKLVATALPVTVRELLALPFCKVNLMLSPATQPVFAARVSGEMQQ